MGVREGSRHAQLPYALLPLALPVVTGSTPCSLPPAAVGVETLNLEQAGLDELERALDRCQGFVLG